MISGMELISMISTQNILGSLQRQFIDSASSVRPSNTFKEKNINLYLYLMLKRQIDFFVFLFFFLLLVMSSRPPYWLRELDSRLFAYIVQFQDRSNDSIEFDSKTLEWIAANSLDGHVTNYMFSYNAHAHLLVLVEFSQYHLGLRVGDNGRVWIHFSALCGAAEDPPRSCDP